METSNETGRQEGQPETGLVIAGVSGGSGKSVVAVGVTALLRERGRRVAPFKKGPDYIDAGWLALAAGNECRNLDPFLMDRDTMARSCLEHARGCDLVLVEGNRGLFDGVNVEGAYSTAELSILLGLPVILVVDCTKMTRTTAAVVMGCLRFDPAVRFGGIILNRIGSARHERLVRQAIETYAGVPVLGAVPRRAVDIFPQRHIGITPCPEFDGAEAAVRALAAFLRDHVDMDALEAAAGPFTLAPPDGASQCRCETPAAMPLARIGLFRDEAFQFYYPENLEALRRLGAELVEINALTARELPELDGLYIGGGFPETSVGALSANRPFIASLRRAIEGGLPVYAECGGLLYLGASLKVDGRPYPLAGIFPVEFEMEAGPQAHGYTVLETEDANPFFPPGFRFQGHEFRYSRVAALATALESPIFRMERGTGFADGRDGLVHRNVLALYTHVHALATPEWAPAFMGRVRLEMARRQAPQGGASAAGAGCRKPGPRSAAGFLHPRAAWTSG